MTAAGEGILRLEEVTVVLGGRTVLQVPGLAIERGKRTCLVGPNGSGKSVTLSLLAGLHRPHAGRLHFDGAVIADSASRRRMRKRVTMVHQTPYLFRGTVRKNVVFGLKARDVPAGRRRAIAARALAEVGLAGFEGRDARSLSGGETQRVAIARAMACRPEVFLLDEPTAGADARSVGLIEETILALSGDGEKGPPTVVFTTHDAAQARRLGERLLFLNAGRVFESPPRNLLHGVVTRVGGAAFFDTGRLRVALASGEEGREGVLGIEEGALRLGSGEILPRPLNSFPGTVEAVAMEDGRFRVDVAAGERFTLLVSLEELVGKEVRPGRKVTVEFPPESTVLY